MQENPQHREPHLIEQLEEREEKNVNNAQNKEENAQQDEIDHYADETPLPKAKPLDLKSLWLGQTNNMLQKFDNTYNQIKKQQKGIQQGFKIFAENQNRYKLSSLRKININLDKKQLYSEYMLKTRKTIQKINPALIINILSYTNTYLFLALLRIRKVSKIFNEIYINQSIQFYMAQKDYLFTGAPQEALKNSLCYCKKYMSFYRTFLYYKEMKYCEQIPQNSIMKDFEDAVNFINQIHKLVIEKNNRVFTYFELVNNFMKKHRVVIGLSSLSLTSLVMVRKAAIIAFSNYLAFNQNERTKEQITKTKYSKVIAVVDNEDYRESLLINTKVSNFLQEKYNINFAVLVSQSGTAKNYIPSVGSWNILIYHIHNQEKAIFLQGIQLKENKFESGRLDLQFSQNMSICTFSTIQYLNWVKVEAEGKLMNTIISLQQKSEPYNKNKDKNVNEVFSFCYFYKLEQYYIIAIPNKFQ